MTFECAERPTRPGRVFYCLPLLAVAVLSGCVMNESPGVRACVSRFSLSAPAGGPLRVIPSRIPGVEIDTATWESTAGTLDIGAYQNLEFRLSLRSRHDSLDGQVVAMFELRGRNGETVLYTDDRLYLSDRGHSAEFLTTNYNKHDADKRFHTKTWKQLTSGMATGPFSVSKGMSCRSSHHP